MVALVVVLLASCSAGSSSDGQDAADGQSPPIDGPDEDFTETERSLLDLLIAPDAPAESHRIVGLEVEDNDGTMTVGDAWYEPALVLGPCSYVTDHAQIPQVAASYALGDPADSMTGFFDDLGLEGREPGDIDQDEGAQIDAALSERAERLAEAPYIVTLVVWLLDDAQQRDAFASVMSEALFGVNRLECRALGLAQPVDAIDLGVPALGARAEGSLRPPAIEHVYSVGDRVLLQAVLSGAPFAESDAADLNPATLEEFVRLQFGRLCDRDFC